MIKMLCKYKSVRRSKGNRCRCCHKTLQTNYHLVFDANGKKQNIACLLFDYIGKRLNENDGLDQAICDACLHQLIQCHEFKQKCIQASAVDSDESTSDHYPDDVDKDAVNYDLEHFHEQVKMVTDSGDGEIIEYEDVCDGNGPSVDTNFRSTKYINGNYEMSELNSKCISTPNFSIDANNSNIVDQRFEIIECTEDNYEKQVTECSASDEMYVEYLEDIDDVDNDEVKQNANFKIEGLARIKAPPFDFSSVMVQPIICLQINSTEDLTRIKQKIKASIPRHMVDLKQSGAVNQNLDVEKIVTSDDLINILEDDYQSESSYAKRVRDDVDVFKIPKIQTCSEIEYLDEVEHVDIDEYLKSIASICYEQTYENYVICKLCSEELTSQQHMLYHINECHTSTDGVLCIFDFNCPPLSDLIMVQQHIFSEHVDLIPTKLYLTCVTCANTFKSSVQFGKHICLMVEDENPNFQCTTCDQKLSSKKRYLFHNQFHLENSRPKVCIICELNFQDEKKFYNHVMFSHERIFEHFCDQCDKSFSSKFRLELHIRVNHTKRTVQCGSCDKSFVDKNMLDEHIGSKHSIRSQTERSLTCPVCGKIFNRPSRLKKHMTGHENPKQADVLICEKCSMAFATNEAIDEHCHRLHDDDDSYIAKKELMYVVCCEFCEIAFVDHHKLVRHKETHLNDEKPFKCEYCMACYETYSKLKTHKNTHVSQQIKFPVQRNYMCDRNGCWKRYRHWSDLLNHRKTVHLINPTIFKCGECEQTFYQSWNFSYHKKTVHSAASVQCEECGIECLSVYSLKAHEKKHHSAAGTSDSFASKKSRSARVSKTAEKKENAKATVDIDQYLMKAENVLTCNLCGKQLSTRNNARSHIEMVHLKVKNHSCVVCGKEFYLRKDYDDHIRLHTSETPYKCRLCEKQFRTVSMLNEHRKSHSTERPHRCPYCVSAFKRAYVLKNHIKQHIGIKGFACSFSGCDKEYRTQWELNSHQRQKHIEKATEKKSYSDLIVKCAPSEGDTNILSSTSDAEKPKPLRKRKQIATKRSTIKKNKMADGKQIIYILPGPASDKSASNNQNHLLEIKKKTDADHNYPSKINPFDTNTATINSSNVVHIMNPEISVEYVSNDVIDFEEIHKDHTMQSIGADGEGGVFEAIGQFDKFTIMDIGAIQVIEEQDGRSIMF